VFDYQIVKYPLAYYFSTNPLSFGTWLMRVMQSIHDDVLLVANLAAF